MEPAEIIAQALRETSSTPDPPTRLGTVTARNAGGVRVQFDGESAAGIRDYLTMTSVEIGERVLMLRVGSTWVVASILTNGAPIMSRSYLNAAEVTGSGAWFALINWTQHVTHPDITYSGTSTWTIGKPGVYRLSMEAMFRNEVSSAGVRAVGIHVNGVMRVGTYAAPIAAQADYASAFASSAVVLAAGDAIQFRTLQNSGGSVTIHGDPWTWNSIERLR